MTTQQQIALDSLAGLEPQHVSATPVTYRGRRALRLVERPPHPDYADTLAILSGTDFQDGIIETAIAGDRDPAAPPEMRGFIGIAFRVQPQAARLECFYLRPTNGRANDQLRRNHATQYVAHPDYPWYRLRTEHPGVYESYTDLEPGAWTRLKIVVAGTRAQLYVNGADQPCLIVNDLKLGESRGQLALWIGFGTIAHFSAITITPLSAAEAQSLLK